MTRRSAPEEVFETLPLFAAIEQAEKAAKLGMKRAADHAEKVSPGWKADALEAVRVFARGHLFFLTEEIEFVIPTEADPRAVGGVMRAATSAGFIVADGVARANSSNRSHKTRWRSLINNRSRES